MILRIKIVLKKFKLQKYFEFKYKKNGSGQHQRSGRGLAVNKEKKNISIRNYQRRF